MIQATILIMRKPPMIYLFQRYRNYPIKRFLTNGMLHLTHEGDVHIYKEKEILSLFPVAGFRVSSFQRIHKDAFLAKALK